MGTLYLVRHGQASWDADDYDVLSPLGWEQGRMTGRNLVDRGVSPDFVVRGDLRRHRETLEAVCDGAGWEVPEVVDKRWDEFDHEEVLRRHMPTAIGEGPSAVQFQQWLAVAMRRWTDGEETDYSETFEEFCARTYAALLEAADRVGKGSSGVVVTSGGVIAWLVSALVRMWEPGEDPTDLGRPWSRLNPVVVNTSVTKVSVGLSGIRVLTFNEHSHLEGGGPVSYR